MPSKDFTYLNIIENTNQFKIYINNNNNSILYPRYIRQLVDKFIILIFFVIFLIFIIFILIVMVIFLSYIASKTIKMVV